MKQVELGLVLVGVLAAGCFGSNGEDVAGLTDGGASMVDDGSGGSGGNAGSSGTGIGNSASGGSSGSTAGSSGGGAGGGGGAAGDAAGSGGSAGEMGGAGGSTGSITVSKVDKIDMLFMVDNSGSMREEQEALRTQFPRMVQVLTTGDLDGDGAEDFSPVSDLHLGVVSSDMGLLGIEAIPGCQGFGDDGIMNNIPSPSVEGCQAAYPRFLSYTAGVNDPSATSTDFACVAALGTDGCGFEQPLESVLKALWPSVDRDLATGEVYEPNRIQFLSDPNGFGGLGHGDQENAGFLRNDVESGVSLVVIVIVSDEEDCSSADTRHFTPDVYLQEGDPLRDQDLNLRCFYNPQNLFVIDRYVNGFKALRAGAEQLVQFAAIVGVPPDLVGPGSLPSDYADDLKRESFYDTILNDLRMQEVPDPNRTPEQGGNLTPSCITDTGRAYPPRRYVQVARGFGENGIVQSICQADFGPAIGAILERIANRLDNPSGPSR